MFQPASGKRVVNRILWAAWLVVFLFGGVVAAQTDAPPKPAVPDLSAMDADTLRAVAKQLYIAIDDAKRRLTEAAADLKAAKDENARLKLINKRLESDLRKLQDERRNSSRNTGGTAAEPPPRPPDPAADEPKLEKVTGELTPVQRTIREQAHAFSDLNEQPNEFLGKPITLFGYAMPTKHTSQGMFDDRGTPRQFVALCDVDGGRVFVSFPKQGNEKLFELINSKGKLAIKVDATGISTKQHQVFEAAGGKWETLDEATGNPPN